MLRFSRTIMVRHFSWTTAFGSLKWLLANRLKLCVSLPAFLPLRTFKSFTFQGGRLWIFFGITCHIPSYDQHLQANMLNTAVSENERLWCGEFKLYQSAWESVRVPECWGKQEWDFRIPIDSYEDLSSIQSAQESQREHDSFGQTRVWENPYSQNNVVLSGVNPGYFHSRQF